MTPSVIFITVVIFSHNPSASPRYCLCRLCSQLGTVPRYLVWQCLSVSMAGLGMMYSHGPEQSCMVLHHVCVRWCRQSLAFLLSETQTPTLQPHPKKQSSCSWCGPILQKMYISQRYVLPWRICVTLPLPLLGIRAKSGCYCLQMVMLSQRSLLSVRISNEELVYSKAWKLEWLQWPREGWGWKALSAAAKAGHHPSLEIKCCRQLSAAQRQLFFSIPYLDLDGDLILLCS